MKKMLFLDIDGVCNCAQTRQRFGMYVGIDKDMADRVKRIIAETGCQVVLSSTWRLEADFRAEVKKRVCDFTDCTPDLQRGRRYGLAPRGQEVAMWLSEHPDVERYAILDDNSDFQAGQPLFLTSWSTGLTDEIADRVIEHLNREEAK